MPTIQILHVSKYGLQPLLLEWEVISRMGHVYFSAIVWPAVREGGAPAHEMVARFGVRIIGPSEDDEDDGSSQQFADVTKAAAHEAAMIRAGEIAVAEQRPVDAVSLEPVDSTTLRAWRSLGYYAGLVALAQNSGEITQALQDVSDVEFERQRLF